MYPLVWFVAGVAVSAVALRAGIDLYHRWIGGADGEQAVPKPSYGRAMAITLVAMLLNVILGAVFDFVLDGATGWGRRSTARIVVLNVVGLPVGMAVLTSVLHRMLPTEFRRAVRVALCTFLAVLALVLIVWIGMSAVVWSVLLFA